MDLPLFRSNQCLLIPASPYCCAAVLPYFVSSLKLEKPKSITPQLVLILEDGFFRLEIVIFFFFSEPGFLMIVIPPTLIVSFWAKPVTIVHAAMHIIIILFMFCFLII